MTVITHARRQSRLAKMIDSAGGVSIGVALSRARENLAALRGQALEEIARHIDDLTALEAPGTPAETEESLLRIYRSATGLIDAAGPFDLDQLCAVASSLCDMADRAATDPDAFDWRIITVHIQSLRLLNTLPAGATAERKQVVKHLAAMVARKFGQAD